LSGLLVFLRDPAFADILRIIYSRPFSKVFGPATGLRATQPGDPFELRHLTIPVLLGRTHWAWRLAKGLNEKSTIAKTQIRDNTLQIVSLVFDNRVNFQDNILRPSVDDSNLNIINIISGQEFLFDFPVFLQLDTVRGDPSGSKYPDLAQLLKKVQLNIMDLINQILWHISQIDIIDIYLLVIIFRILVSNPENFLNRAYRLDPDQTPDQPIIILETSLNLWRLWPLFLVGGGLA
jgi:hypothetical protein